MHHVARRAAGVVGIAATAALGLAMIAPPANAIEYYTEVAEHCVGFDSEGGGPAYSHPTFGTVSYPAPYYGGASQC